MKIAIIAHALYPIKQPYAGGLEMITHLLCSMLVAKGHHVDLYAHKDSITPAFIIPIADNDEAVSTDVDTSQPMSYGTLMSRIDDLGYDIIHNHSLHQDPIRIGNTLDTPFITTFHTPAFKSLLMGLETIDANNVQQHFTVVSKRMNQIWSAYIAHSHVIYNGIAVEDWDCNTGATADYLFWYGRICKEKGTHEAIQFALDAGQVLYLAGPISNEPYFEECVAPYLEHPSITYLGHLEHNAINDYLKNAKACLITSTWEEPYGLVIAESMSCGTPVVAFDLGAAPELLTEETGLLLPLHENYDAKEALKIVCALDRKKCRMRAEEFCSYQQMVNSYLDLYKKIISEKNILENPSIISA